jgi:hypothetical protein
MKVNWLSTDVTRTIQNRRVWCSSDDVGSICPYCSGTKRIPVLGLALRSQGSDILDNCCPAELDSSDGPNNQCYFSIPHNSRIMHLGPWTLDISGKFSSTLSSGDLSEGSASFSRMTLYLPLDEPFILSRYS